MRRKIDPDDIGLGRSDRTADRDVKLRSRAIRVAALGAFCAYAGAGFSQSPPAVPSPSGKTSPLSLITLDALQATRERPLFAASRRPPQRAVSEAPTASAPPPPPEKPDVALVGIIYGPELRIGIFSDANDKTVIRVHLGESVRGWTLRDIDRRAAVLEKAQEHVELKLPAHDIETVAGSQRSLSLLATPVGPIKSFATAGRDR